MEAVAGFACLLFLPCICALLGAAIGSRRERTIAGGLLGFVFGPLGVLFALLLDYSYSCPDCGTGVKKSARRCPACRCKLA